MEITTIHALEITCPFCGSKGPESLTGNVTQVVCPVCEVGCTITLAKQQVVITWEQPEYILIKPETTMATIKDEEISKEALLIDLNRSLKMCLLKAHLYQTIIQKILIMSEAELQEAWGNLICNPDEQEQG